MGILTRLGRWLELRRSKSCPVAGLPAVSVKIATPRICQPTSQPRGIFGVRAGNPHVKEWRQLASAAPRASTNRCAASDRRLPELIKLSGESLNVIRQQVVDFSRDYELP